jgi:hypothetical protein
MSKSTRIPVHWRNASLALAFDIILAWCIVLLIDNPESFWKLPTVVLAFWFVPWAFRLKAGVYYLFNYYFNERAEVVLQIAQELASKNYPCPDERYDLAEDYFTEVATSDEAPVEARLSAAKYLGADAAWGQSQQILTRWLFNRAALEVIAGYRKTFQPDVAG